MTVPATSFVETRARTSRASVAIAVSLLLTSAFGAGQAVVLVAILGQGERTDAFFAAYSVYLPLVLWAASLRSSVVPLVLLPHATGDDLRRAHAATVASRVVGIGAAGSAVLLCASPVLAAALGHGMSGDARRLLLECVALLAVAGFLQFWAATLSAILSSTRRFVFSAFVYAAASAIAVGTSAILLSWVGAIGAAIGLAAGAVFSAGAHVVYLRRLGVPTRVSGSGLLGRDRGLIVKVLAGGALLAAQQVQLAITVYSLSPTRGAITSFTYAFVLVNLLVSLSLSPLSLALMPSFVRDAAASGVAAARAQVVRVIPIAADVMLPCLLALVAFADPIIPSMLGGLLTPGGVDNLVVMVRILGAVAIPTAFFFVGGNALHALQRWHRVLWLSVAAVAIHAAIVIPLVGEDPEVVTAGHAAAVAVVAALVLRATLGPKPLRPVRSALVRSAPAAALALVIVAARLAAGRDPAAPLAWAALLGGLTVYASLLVALRPEVRSRVGSLVGR